MESYYDFVLKLMRLSLLYKKTSGNDRILVKEQMNSLAEGTNLKIFDGMPEYINICIQEIFIAYKTMYLSNSVEREHEFEKRIECFLNEIKEMLGIEGTEDEIFKLIQGPLQRRVNVGE